MAQPNQFTKAREAGLPVPGAQNQFTTGKRTRHDEGTKDKMRSERALKFLDKTVKGKGSKDEKPSFADRIAAAKAMIPFGKPLLSAVEQSQADPWDGITEDQMIEQAKALILSHPEIIQALNLIPNPVAVPQSTDKGLVTTITETLMPTGTSE